MAMDYKKLYEENQIILTNASPEKLKIDAESVEYMREYFKRKDRFVPPVNFSDPKNFARFGSAEKYYIDAIDRIYQTYPYDGSLKERVQWELSSSYFDLYIFDEVYPRTNGYIIFSADGWSSQSDVHEDYGEPTTKEYIFSKGGPNTSKRSKDKGIRDVSGDYSSGYANFWEPKKNRECNLKIGGVDGNTVEFWMKKSDFIPTLTGREVIFDAYTENYISSSLNYGRLTIEMTSSADAAPFRITYMSGTSGFADEIIGSSLTTASVADDSWHHYAFTFKNNPKDTSEIEANFYFDGVCNETILTGSSVDYVSSSVNAIIGALSTAPSGSVGTAAAIGLGWGKLSGSLDEFRFWKTKRTSNQINRYMIEPVGGGTNTDDANTDLGVYYKFNEGITQTASIDENILDYSGRISNGSFVGYGSTARNVGSAMISSGLVDHEFKDPILYNFHPDVQNLREDKKQIGLMHDYSNNASIYHSLPTWITEENGDAEYSPLRNLIQIMGSYFDTISQQIEAISYLKHKNYLSSSFKPYPFADRLLQSIGFTEFPELFSDATALEYFLSRNEKTLFEKKLYDVKNSIYQNIYNNIVYIYKTKGTEKSFRNLIHCFGLGDEIYRINTYGNRVKYRLKDNFKTTSEYKKYVNFTLTGTAEASVFPYSASTNFNSQAAISASNGDNLSYLSFTMENEVFFPIRHSLADSNTTVSTKKGPSRQFRTTVPYITASLFGIHQIDADSAGNDLTWASSDYANFQVQLFKSSDFSKRAKFVLRGTGDSVIGPLELESDYIDDVFDDTRWTFSVSVRPGLFSQSELVSGSNDPNYKVEFYGVEKVIDTVRNEFLITGTLSTTDGQRFMTNPKAPFIGAHRTNFSGTLQEKTDGNMSSTRVWLSYLPTGTLKQHNQDVKNYGTDHPYRSNYLYPTSLTETRVPQIDTLVLNWTFDNITGSDSSGEFLGEDFSSGSTSKQERYGWFGEIVGKQYLPKGIDFPANTSFLINKKYVYSAKKQLPEIINSSDMVNILQDDDRFFNKVDLLRPTNSYLSIEKSMYQTISEEMVKMFSTIKDFNNLIGEPVNKYRDDYKHMSKLRQLFFERVGNTPDLDKYIDFYKWVDITLDTLLGYLVPASGDISDEYGSNVRTMVENHLLQRNKYKWQYPTLEDKTPDIEGNVLGIKELLYNWEFGTPPLPDSPLDQSQDCRWWKERAERTQGDLSSGDSYVDSDRQTILDTIMNETNASAPILAKSSSSGIETYAGSTYAIRKLARPYQFKTDQVDTQKNALTSYQNKNVGFFGPINQFRAGAIYGIIQVDEDDFYSFKDCDDDLELNNGKRKYSFTARSKILREAFLYNDKSLAFPGGAAPWDDHQALISDSDSLSFGADGTIGNEPSFSISAWVYMTDASNFAIFSKAQSTTREYALDTGGSDNLIFRIYDSAHTVYIGVTTFGAFGALTAYENQWVHICATYDASRAYTGMKLYINGAAISTAQSDAGSYTAMHNTGEDAQFGRMYDAQALMTTGFIDETSAFNKELSSAEVLELYNDGVVFDLEESFSAAANLVSWWRMGDKATGTSPDYTIPDQIGSNDVAMSNFDGTSTSGVVNKAAPTVTFEVDDYDDEYKGDKILPFNLYSSSIEGGVNEFIDDNFKEGVDITNLHLDTYSPDYEIPIQSTFTERFVGGHPHRHVYTNFAPDNDTPDTSAERLEGWKLDINSNSLKVLNADYGNANFPRSRFLRDEYAKRPINIKNIQMTTGSDGYIDPDNTTKIGNYTSKYELVMTSGRSINNRYFVKNGGITTSSIDSKTIEGVMEYSLPGALKSDVVRTQVTNNSLTSSARNDYIIVNRFAAPGDPTTMTLAYLDVASQEYSTYNAMTWRNLIVRQDLNEQYTDHTKQFGYFSDTQNSASYALAGETYPGTSGSVNALNYEGSASFHKVNRNSRRVIKLDSSDTYISGTVYDNWFVQHQIPQSDLQYAWITASVINDYTGSALYGFEQPDFSNASLASTDITFCSASDFGSYIYNNLYVHFGIPREEVGGIRTNHIPVDFAGLNTLIVEPITSSENHLGYDPSQGIGYDQTGDAPPWDDTHYFNNDYIYVLNSDSDATRPGGAAGLNSLILHRQGPYGWPSWKQIRGGQHPIMRAHKKENIQSFLKTTIIDPIPTDAWKGVQLKSVFNQVEPPITSKFNPLKHSLVYKKSNDNSQKPIIIWNSYGNQKGHFTDPPDFNISGITNINNSNFIHVNAGNASNTLNQANQRILIYDTLNKFLLKSFGGYISGAANPISDITSLDISETIYPREHYTYLSGTRSRLVFSNNFWRDLRDDRTLTSSNANSQGNILEYGSSMWSLDARIDFATAQPNPSDSTGKEGELQNNYSLFFDTDYHDLQAGAAYIRHVPESASVGILYAGDTKWEANTQADVNPFFNSFEEFSEDTRRVGKDYGIIPEFRISEHMEFYVKNNPKAPENWTVDNDGWLTLTGSSPSGSLDSSFYTIYSNSDFMKYFEPIRTDYENTAVPTTLTLKCKGITKFLPYDGFYPAERTVQLAQMFSQSYGVGTKDLGTGMASKIVSFTGEENWRTLLTPIFSPGILYNSIKSGMAVDYPISTTNFPTIRMIVTGSSELGTKDDGDRRLKGTFYTRIPFEALASPEVFLNGKKIIDLEPHPSASIDSTGSFYEPDDPLFKYAMNNFLAEVPAFFLGGTDGKNKSLLGPLSTLYSDATGENSKITVDGGKTYVMRIICSHSKITDLQSLKDNDDRTANSASFVYNPPTITLYNRSFDRSKTTEHGYSASFVGENNATVAYGSSFGPPCDASSSINGDEASFEPYTPPYYNGYSHIELSYTPDAGGGDVSISDILGKIADSESSYREPLRSGSLYAGSTAAGQGMSLSASLNYKQEISTPEGQRWVIQPKWECPVLDFNEASITLPEYGSGSVAKGIWHQYGRIPKTEAGIFISVEDVPSSEITEANGAEPYSPQAVTQSLAQLLGFKGSESPDKPLKIGKIPVEGKTISEAIVAVPFALKQGICTNEKGYFNIPEKTIQWASAIVEGKEMFLDFDMKAIEHLKPAQSVKTMVEMMKKYVLPPKFDFLNFPEEVDPFAMVFFEFKMDLKQEDLVNIWQNLPPVADRKNAPTVKQCANAIGSIELDLLSGLEQLDPDHKNWLEGKPYKGFGLLNEKAVDHGVTGDLLIKFPSDIQWLVFKVKQRAATNYFDLTAKKDYVTNKSGKPLISYIDKDIPPCSYNWPYDFCSIVELAKIESIIKLEPKVFHAFDLGEPPAFKDQTEKEEATDEYGPPEAEDPDEYSEEEEGAL